MSIILILASAGFLLALGFLVAFYWATKSGQFDDTYTPSVRILHDELHTPEPNTDPSHVNELNSKSNPS
ncbi:MAG: cbb3-type cytochrome oxidase assembly protein CcoS [Bacteroidales bacterium]|jgi:cbb3-type cytochrome oxidase maturation protein|nr:cbb3-type cytochrome oxidase assembly protein CcoS [Bacteroidales bacterium]NPV36751.1 cbb3-type cytochrome oxidase assembly protein CcoS [Bacteroidales bacterium]